MEKMRVAWQTIVKKQKIIQLFKHMVMTQSAIEVRLNGEETDFTSRVIKINQEHLLSEIGKKPELVIEKLIPEKGNNLIQSSSKVTVFFSLQQSLWRCNLEYVGISNTYPHFGHILHFPESIEVEEKRKEKRVVYKRPKFISVEFSMEEKSKEGKLFKFDVLESSKYGLGIIVPRKDFDLIEKINIGDKIENITFYAPWAMIKVNGTVRHKTQINEGDDKGSYILGIESSEIIES